MQCVLCGQVKLASEFYAKDKKCKVCRRALVLENRWKNIDHYREYDRKRADKPHRVEKNSKTSKQWCDDNPMRRSAQIALGNAVRSGKVQKWPACAVPDCCSTRPVAHHPDYDRPLDVVWLCQAHHKQAHALVTTG